MGSDDLSVDELIEDAEAATASASADDTSAAPDVREAGNSGATDEHTDDDTDADPRIAELTAARDEFKDIAQRVQAEFDNYRKRSAAQLAAEIERATGAFAEALLPVLDAAEAAYVTNPDEVGPLFNLLLGELRKRGLEQIDLLGQPFDPNLADAVAHEPGDGGEPRVAEVLRSGYTWKGKTLRAAMVRTAD